MKQIKFMTNAQIKRIQENNYCSEHDSKGNQFDYEAKGYRDEINALYWSRKQKEINEMLKRASNRHFNEYQDKISKSVGKLDENPFKTELDACEREISVNKAFFKWRNIVNELNLKLG